MALRSSLLSKAGGEVVPDSILSRLEPLQGQEFENAPAFRKALDGVLSREERRKIGRDLYLTSALPEEEVIVTRYTRFDKVNKKTYTYYRVRDVRMPLKEAYENENLPSLLFLGAAAMTLATLLMLWWQLPDLLFRTRLWFRTSCRFKLEIGGMHHLPGNGPVVIVSDGPNAEADLHVLSATDRTARFLVVQEPGESLLPLWIRASLRLRHLGYWTLNGNGANCWKEAAQRARRALDRGEVVGLSLAGRESAEVEKLLGELLSHPKAPPVLPVHYHLGERSSKGYAFLLAGGLLKEASVESVQAALTGLREEFESMSKVEGGLEQVLATAH